MKLTVFLMLAALFQVQATTKAQSVTYAGKDVSLINVLKEVERQTGFFIFYSSKDALKRSESSTITVNVKSALLEDFLKRILGDQGIQFRVEDKTIFISTKKAGTPAEKPAVAAPPINVSGRVTDANGTPIPGATIVVLGTKFATTADAQGRFKMDGIPEHSRIVITAVGYAPATVAFNGSVVIFNQGEADAKDGKPQQETENNVKSAILLESNGSLSVKLARVISNIETVVVTGLFQRSTNNFTGASKTISGAEVKKVSANNVFAAVAALDPSFRIVPNNIAGGNINQLPEIQMRGQNSFPNLSGELSNNPNAPLFILDGFEVSLQRIVDLDMNLINSITLLKDASATAIYGSRGANGVMVVTTVVPKAGKMQFTVTNDFRVTTPDLSVYNLLNAEEKLDFEKRAGVYSSNSMQQQHKMDVLYNERYRAYKSGVNTDWLSIPVHNGYSNRTSLYMQGGDQYIRYGLQLAADLQSGVMKGQNRKNYTGQFDLNYFVKKLQFRNSIRILANNANESPYGSFNEYVRMNPYWAPYDDNGNAKPMLEDLLIANTYYRQTNPVYNATLHSVNNAKYFGISDNLNLRYNALPGLYFETSFSLNRQSGSSDQFYSAQDGRFAAIQDVNQKGSYTARTENSFSYESLTTANLNLHRGPHQVFSTLGLNFASSNNNYYTLVAQGFPYDRLDNLLFAAQYQANSKPTGDESNVRRLGVVFSGNYTYDNRFMADLSFRRDGSSQYGTERKFGSFWSAGIGWNIHNESFFVSSDVVNRLKVRASYGSTGSLNIPAYSALSRYNFGVASGYYNELGAVLGTLGNKMLSWQNVLKANVGMDIVLMNEKIDARVDFYRENTHNSLTQITLAPSTGFSSYAENLGQIQNTGFEFSLRYKIMEKKSDGLLWSVNVNGITNKNILKEISNRLKASNDKLNQGSTQTIPNILLEEGQSTNTIYAVRSLGVDPATGSEVYLTKDGQRTYVWNVADKVPVGIAQPKWNGNFGTNFIMKGFELNLIFNCQFGGQLYNQTLIDRVESVDPSFNVDRRAYELGWKGPGDVSRYTAIRPGKPVTRLTSRFVQDDDNINLSSASIGYNFFRSQFVKRMGFRSLQVTAITNDVFRASSIQIERGTSNPFARTYSLTIRAGF